VHVTHLGIIGEALPDGRPEAARKTAAKDDVIHRLERGMADGTPRFLHGEDGLLVQGGMGLQAPARKQPTKELDSGGGVV
jgi:hypothetical protein